MVIRGTKFSTREVAKPRMKGVRGTRYGVQSINVGF